MSSTIAQPSNMKSMNGIVTYDDGAGTTISGGVVTASALSTQNITAPNPSATSSIYANNSNTITIGNAYTPVYVPRTCASANEVANKAYVDAQTGGAVTLGGTNTWTGQNTFDVYPPLCYLSPTSNDNLVNKLYVDLTVAGGSSSLLAADNVWTGTNQFDNITTIGKADQSSTVTINGEVFIGDGINSPGHNTTIVGDEVKLQGFNSIDMVGDVFFKNSVPQSSIHINTATNAAIPEIDFQTNTSNTSIITSSIIASGGTTLNTGKIQINGGDILIGQDDHSNTVLITGEVQIGDTLNSPAKNTGICGEETTLQGFSNVDIVAPLTTIRTPASQQSMTLDPTTSGTMKMNFRTNTSNTSQISSNITATGGTATNNGNLNLTAGVITNVTPEFVVSKTSSSSMTVLPNNSSEVEIQFNTNPTDPNMSTVRMIAASGTVADRGRFSFYASIVEWFASAVTFWSNTFSQSLFIDLSNTVNTIGLRFRTAGGTTPTSTIYATGTTTADSTITTTANASWLKNRDIYFDPASGGNSQINLNYYTYTTNPLIISSQIIASGGTATSLQGNLDTYCNAFRVWAPTVMIGNGNGVVDVNGTQMTLDATNTICNGEMTFNNNVLVQSGLTTIGGSAELRFTTTGGSYPMYTNLPIIGITNTTGGGTVTAVAWNTIQYGSTYYFSVNCTGTWSYVLPSTIRPGNMCRVFNLGTGNVNLSVAGGAARMFGDGLLRTGNVSYTIAPLKGARIECVEGTGIVGIGGNVYFIAVF